MTISTYTSKAFANSIVFLSFGSLMVDLPITIRLGNNTVWPWSDSLPFSTDWPQQKKMLQNKWMDEYMAVRWASPTLLFRILSILNISFLSVLMVSAPIKLRYNKELITSQSYIFIIFYSFFFLNSLEHAFPVISWIIPLSHLPKDIQSWNLRMLPYMATDLADVIMDLRWRDYPGESWSVITVSL